MMDTTSTITCTPKPKCIVNCYKKIKITAFPNCSTGGCNEEKNVGEKKSTAYYTEILKVYLKF